MNEEDQAPAKTVPLHRLLGVRGRLLVVVAAAILPTFGVGLTTWLAARSALRDKTSGQLATRVNSVRQRVESWFAERREDAEIFSSSFLIAEALSGHQGGAEGSIDEYLRQVRERFPLYTTLAVADSSGTLVARAGAPQDGPLAVPVGTILTLESGAAGPRLRVSRAVLGPDESKLGVLTAVSELDGLWRRLGADLDAELGELRLVSEAGAVSLKRDGPAVTPTSSLLATDLERCGTERVDVAQYRNRDGAETLGACRRLEPPGLVVLVELDARTALASVESLTNPSLVILLIGMVVVFLLCWALVGSVVRPIDALIEAARAVSSGDYSHRIPVKSSDELGYLSAVFNDMTEALRISHGELEELSRTDQLTGLANRRHLDEALSAELNRAQRQRAPLSLVMVDLDHFKAFNDRFGHQQGDAQLQRLAALLRVQLRPTDIVARYGGEEFTILLPGIPKDEALRVSERLRQKVAELGTPEGGAGVTASFGVATFPEDGSDGAPLLATADAALYAAKAAGRDRVVAAGATAGSP